MALGPFYKPADLKKIDDKVGIVRMISGKTGKGEDCYAYVSVKPSMYEEFSRKVENGEPMNVDSYGKVLHKGFGKEPSDDIKRYMEEQYGIDHNFAENLGKAMVEEARKQEEKK